MKGKMLLLVAFLIICFNLRTGFDSPDPLLGTIEKDMGLSLENSGLFAQRRKVKDFFIKFKKKSHSADFFTEQTLDLVLHCLFCGLAEMHTDDIGGLADLLSDSRARGVVSCGIVHSKSSCK